LWPAQRLQLRAYAHILEHAYGTDVDHGLLVELRADGTYREERIRLTNDDLIAVYAARDAYAWLAANDKPWYGK
jgi:hypothetical protein